MMMMMMMMMADDETDLTGHLVLMSVLIWW